VGVAAAVVQAVLVQVLVLVLVQTHCSEWL
jgi:hypothetical protein